MDFFFLSVIDVLLRSAVRVCFFDQYAKGMHAFFFKLKYAEQWYLSQNIMMLLQIQIIMHHISLQTPLHKHKLLL